MLALIRYGLGNAQKPEVETASFAPDPFHILRTEQGIKTVIEWISTYPNENRGENREDIEKIVRELLKPEARDTQYLNILYANYPVLATMHRQYEESFKDSSLPPLTVTEKEKLFRSFIKGPLVVDVGCNRNTLGKEIMRNNPQITQAIGVDIEDHTADPTADFILMQDPPPHKKPP